MFASTKILWFVNDLNQNYSRTRSRDWQMDLINQKLRWILYMFLKIITHVILMFVHVWNNTKGKKKNKS